LPDVRCLVLQHRFTFNQCAVYERCRWGERRQ
jgi:hypothetical protein